MTAGEITLVGAMFGSAIDCTLVRIHRRRWWPMQPRGVIMAPCGHLHFARGCPHYRDDFSTASIALQGLFVHEMTHVWQTQQRGKWYLPLHRHPFCRYRYRLVSGRKFGDYGIEQQAEIVRHAFLARNGNRPVHGGPEPGRADALERLIPFNAISYS